MTRKWGEHPNDGKGLERISERLKADIHPTPILFMGTLAAAVVVNEHGVLYIDMCDIEHAEEEDHDGLKIDAIEAKALYDWLGSVLHVTESTVAGDAE